MSWNRAGRCTVPLWAWWTSWEGPTPTTNCSCWRTICRKGRHFFVFVYLTFPPGTCLNGFFLLVVSRLFEGTGCSDHGAEWVPPSEETNWTNSMTRTRLWIIFLVFIKKRRETNGARLTLSNIPLSSTHWRLIMDRWGKHRCSSLCWKVVRLLRCGLFFFAGWGSSEEADGLCWHQVQASQTRSGAD